MIKKIIISIFLIFLISQAGDFIQYDRAFCITPAYTQEADDMKGVALSINYVQRAGKTVFDFSVTPKYLYWREEATYSYGNTTIVFEDTSFVNPKYSFSSQKKITIEAAILFSHRPSIRVREGAGALTFNFWKYGIAFEWDIFKMYRSEVDGYIEEHVIKNQYLDKNIGIIYKPSMGIQLTDKINISVELMYNLCIELDDTPFPYPKFGSGISFTLSNPVKSF